jgi:hypothetical protein
MAATYKVLGQSIPAAITNTSAYTVPGGKTAVISTITVCNQSASSQSSFRIAIRVAGATLTASQYISFDDLLQPRETKAFTLGITLGATDIVTVYSSNGNVSFGVFGSEIV